MNTCTAGDPRFVIPSPDLNDVFLFDSRAAMLQNNAVLRVSNIYLLSPIFIYSRKYIRIQLNQEINIYIFDASKSSEPEVQVDSIQVGPLHVWKLVMTHD